MHLNGGNSPENGISLRLTSLQTRQQRWHHPHGVSCPRGPGRGLGQDHGCQRALRLSRLQAWYHANVATGASCRCGPRLDHQRCLDRCSSGSNTGSSVLNLSSMNKVSGRLKSRFVRSRIYRFQRRNHGAHAANRSRVRERKHTLQRHLPWL